MPSTRIVVACILFALPIFIFFSCLFAGQAFVPADLLSYIAPWNHLAAESHRVPWNVLRYDGVTQFYPWRLQAARAIHLGRLPFWNPYAFAASGGTPLWANSQSAPLYPLNALFYVFPVNLIWYVFGLITALQLEIAALGTYLFLRRCLELRRASALLAAITFILSAPITCWLALPTFLSVACWIPWLLLLIHRAFETSDREQNVRRILAVGVAAGLMILGGHLQISLYGLSLGFAYSSAQWMSRRQIHDSKRRISGYGAGLVIVVIVALCLASPQLLPSIELSRVSHRAAAGFPTWAAYQSYVANALPIRNLVTLLFPNFFGHPNSTDGLYWNTNNYAEWALFTGVTPLLLCCFSLGIPWKKGRAENISPAWLENRRFFAAAAAVSLLIAMGTVVNVPLFFMLPGYSQTGNPGRVLVIFAFSVAVLAALGLEALTDSNLQKAAKDRAALVALGVPTLLAAYGASQAALFQREVLPGTMLSSLLAPEAPSFYIEISVFLAASVVVLLAPPRRARTAGSLLAAISVLDLILWGWRYNPSVRPDRIYPATPGIRYLLATAADTDIVAPLNRGWSLGGYGPRRAVLPPNTLTVFGLHDAAGYDSLFYQSAKEQIRDAGGGLDPSPPENGNMLFVKDAEIAVRLGARFIVTAPDAPLQVLPPYVRPVYRGDDLSIYENAQPAKFDRTIGENYAPTSIRFGLFAALSALALISGSTSHAILSGIFRRARRSENRLP